MKTEILLHDNCVPVASAPAVAVAVSVSPSQSPSPVARHGADVEKIRRRRRRMFMLTCAPVEIQMQAERDNWCLTRSHLAANRSSLSVSCLTTTATTMRNKWRLLWTLDPLALDFNVKQQPKWWCSS